MFARLNSAAVELVMIVGQLALIVAAAFTGAAIYVSACEHPARLSLGDQPMLAQWKPSYNRGKVMQGALALIGAIFGLIAWWQSDRWLWLIGSLALIAPWPFTLVVIKPTNNALLATDLEQAGAGSRALIERWGRLHAVRTALGLAATIFFFAASVT